MIPGSNDEERFAERDHQDGGTRCNGHGTTLSLA